MDSFSLEQARRIALAAQGFTNSRPERVGRRQLARVGERLGVVQIDSVNVLSRSHYLPYYSRLGAYDPAILDEFRDGAAQSAGVSRRPRQLVEQWAHEASLVAPQTWPYLWFRMASPRSAAWAAAFAVEHPSLLSGVQDVIGDRGPLTARQIAARLPPAPALDKDHWGWNWSAAKQAAEVLFRIGELTSAGRTPQFERLYAMPEHVLPSKVLDQAERPSDAECFAYLIRLSISALGIATVADLMDYFRLRGPVARSVLADLVKSGEIQTVAVRGLVPTYYLDPAAKRPRKVCARALVSPFDSLVWFRPRAQQLFDFRYRIEIYTPAEKRVYGYYVLPFLLRERLIGRVDLKADRGSGTLLVRSVHWEPDAPSDAAVELSHELETMAKWLGLDSVVDMTKR